MGPGIVRHERAVVFVGKAVVRRGHVRQQRAAARIRRRVSDMDLEAVRRSADGITFGHDDIPLFRALGQHEPRAHGESAHSVFGQLLAPHRGAVDGIQRIAAAAARICRVAAHRGHMQLSGRVIQIAVKIPVMQIIRIRRVFCRDDSRRARLSAERKQRGQ